MRRTVYIHCGLHKTGTTAIQTALADGRDTLRAHGVLYPASGDEHAGHHNLAWQISGRPEFSPDALTITDAVAQIAAFDGDAVLSSEDFESFMDNPAALAPLVQPLRELGRRVCVLVYVRDAASYALSLYMELLKHGFSNTFDMFHAEIAMTGRVQYRQWLFQFNYRQLRAAWRRYRCAQVVWRRYRPAKRSGSVVMDFLPLVGLPATLLGELADRRVNERETPREGLARLVANRLGRELQEGEGHAVDRLFGHLQRSAPAGNAAWLPERVFSDRSVEAVAAIGAMADAEAERSLVSWWVRRPASARLWRFFRPRTTG